MPDYVLFTTEVLCNVKQWICKTDAGKEMAVPYISSVDPDAGYYLHLQQKMSFQVTGTTSSPSSLFKQHNLESRHGETHLESQILWKLRLGKL